LFRGGKSTSCDACVALKRRCGRTEEGSKKRKGFRKGVNKGKGKEREETEAEETENERESEMTGLRRQVAELQEEVKVGNDLLFTMGAAVAEMSDRMTFLFKKNRRELRLMRDVLDEDWEENGSEGSEEEVENGEELEEEMIRLRRTRRRLKREGMWKKFRRSDEESDDSNESEDLGEGSEAEPEFGGKSEGRVKMGKKKKSK